jgi:catechol 2,3-dioxygenase-like lactoylglutathione lyase family enzyme
MLNSLTISHVFVLDQDEAIAFYVGKLGLEVHTDVDLGFMRWLTLNVPGQPDREILLERPGPPAMDEASAEQVRDLLTKGALGTPLIFRTTDAYATHAELKAKGVELTSEPIVQDYGIDFGVRDPFGNNIRIGQID